MFLIVFLIVTTSFFIPVQGPTGKAAADGRQETGIWTLTKLWADKKLLYDAEVGDVWPGHQGTEIVVGGETNWTTMIYGHEDSWHTVPLFQERWYVTNIAIGDPDNDGKNEIVNVGWHGNVSMIYWDEATSKWVHEELVNGLNAHLNWGYGLAIGDFDPRYTGNEIATTDDDGHLTIVRKTATGWTYQIIWSDGGPGITDPYLDTVMLAEVDQAHAGSEILVAGGSKYITELYYNTSSSNWTVKRLFRDQRGPVQVATGDFDPRYNGNEIAVVGLDKNLTTLHYNGTGWQGEKVYKDSDVIYDVEVGEVQPGKGVEVVMGGWSGKVTVHGRAPVATSWDSRTVMTDENFVFGVTIGEFDDLHSGNEIVVVDRAGIVTKLQYETPDFVLYAPTPTNGAVPGASAGFDIMAYSRGGYHGTVNLTVQGLPQGWSATFSPVLVTPTGRSKLQVKVHPDSSQGQVKLTVKGISGYKVHTIDVWVNVLPPDEKDFAMDVLPGSQTVVADFKVTYTIAIFQINTFSDAVMLSVDGMPDGASVSFSPKSLYAPGSSIMTITTVKTTPLGPHYLTVVATGGGKSHSVTVLLTVKDASSPDFSISVAPSTITAVGSVSANISVNLISLYGFSGKVLLFVPDLMTGIHVAFAPPTVVPSATSYMNLTIDASVPADTYYFEIHGTSGDIDHSAVLRVDLNVAGTPDFSLKASPETANITASFTADYNITVVPQKGFGALVDLVVQDIPAGVTAKFEPPSIGPNRTSRLRVKTTQSTPVGQFHIVVKGIGSGLERTVYLSLNIGQARAYLRIVKVDGVPSEAAEGQKIKATVWVENTGIINATGCKLNFYVDGRITSVTDFRVDVNKTEDIEVLWSADDGKHELTYEITTTTPVTIENGKVSKHITVKGTFSVVGGPWVVLLVVVLVVIIVAVAFGWLMGKRRKGLGIKDEGPRARKSTKKKASRPRRAPT